jgi:ribosomal protein S7
MNRLERVLQGLLRDGKLSVAEMIAIYGAVNMAYEAIGKGDVNTFRQEYGSTGRQGLDDLMETGK